MPILGHLTHLVLSSATLSNETFCGSSLIKNLVICVPTTLAKQILFLNHMDRKVVGGKHNVLVHYVDVCAPDSSSVVFCNPFKWDMLLFIFVKNLIIYLCAYHISNTNFIPQLHEQKRCRRQTQCSSTLCGCLCTQPI